MSRFAVGGATLSTAAEAAAAEDFESSPPRERSFHTLSRAHTAGSTDVLDSGEVLFDSSGFHAPDAEFATLFDNLVGLAAHQIVSSIVIAPASIGATCMRVVEGLAAEARRRGLRTLECRMAAAGGRRLLVPESASPGAGGAGANGSAAREPVELDLRGEPGRSELDAWVKAALESFDLIVVAGAPLDTGIDAALLARSCDGLLLVAEEKLTTKQALRNAADRVRAAGCHVFGVAVDNGREQLPSWVRAVSSALGGSRG